MGGDASSSVNDSIDNPVSGGSVDDRPMVGWIFSSEEYTNQYHEMFNDFLNEWLNNGRLAQLISDTAEMIQPYVEKDPTKFCTSEEFETGVSTLTQFITLRAEAVTRQLASDNTPVETDGLNTSDMGSMGGGNGFSMPSQSQDNNDVETPNFFFGESGFNFSQDEMPSSDMFNAFMNGSGVNMPDMDSFPSDMQNPPEGMNPEDGMKNFPQGNGQNNPNGNQQDFQGTKDFSSIQNGFSQIINWIWIGVSIIVLIIGLLIAIKKKY